ncbi:MAG: ABC transporter substrate-binding protein [Thermomicrobiales bacterium]|nr:ABC transporter substrate-binding protein [Thermomicrobiales bacterium]
MKIRHRRLGRRTLLAGATAAAFSAGLASGLPAQEQLATSQPSPLLPAELPSGGVQPDGSWAFTDDLGQTITRPATPTRVVAHLDFAAALYDFGFEVVGYFESAVDPQGNPLIKTGNLPFETLANIGTYGDIDFERMVELGVDLFVAPTSDIASGYVWPFDADTLALIQEITPVLAIAIRDGTNVRRTIETVGSVAAALGADIDSPAIVDAQAAFEAAAADLEAALATQPDLTAMFISADTDGFWVSDNSSDIAFFRSLGLRNLAAPGGEEAAVSWEQFPLWQADLIFNDDRWPDAAELAETVPVFLTHPAAKADQVMPWHPIYVPSYQGFTPILEEVTAVIQAARDDLFV